MRKARTPQTPRAIPAAAETLFRAAKDAAKKGDYATACPEYAESERLDPAAGTLLNLAECEDHLGHPALAWAHFVEAQGMLPDADDRIAFAKRRAAEVLKRTAKLTLRLRPNAPPGSVIARDNVDLGAAALGREFPVDPGTHVLTARAPGIDETKIAITLAEGESKVIELAPILAPGPAACSHTNRAHLRRQPTNQAPGPESTARKTDPSKAPTHASIGYVVGGVGHPCVLGAGSRDGHSRVRSREHLQTTLRFDGLRPDGIGRRVFGEDVLHRQHGRLHRGSSSHRRGRILRIFEQPSNQRSRKRRSRHRIPESRAPHLKIRSAISGSEERTSFEELAIGRHQVGSNAFEHGMAQTSVRGHHPELDSNDDFRWNEDQIRFLREGRRPSTISSFFTRPIRRASLRTYGAPRRRTRHRHLRDNESGRRRTTRDTVLAQRPFSRAFLFETR